MYSPAGSFAVGSDSTGRVLSKLREHRKALLRERAEKDAARSEARASQIGSGDRSQKVRTYNYPENRLTDHRIGLTLYSLDRIITGDKLGDVIDALITEDQSRRLASLEAGA